MAAMRNDKLVEVCDNCLCACCWYGEFMCDDARSAGTVIKTVGELKKLNREHSEYWTDAKFLKVYGIAHPDFGATRAKLTMREGS